MERVGEEETGTFPYLARESVAPERTVMSSIPPAERGLVSSVSLTGHTGLLGGKRRLAGGWGNFSGTPGTREQSLFSLPSLLPGLLRMEAGQGAQPWQQAVPLFPNPASKLDLRFYNAQKEKPLGSINNWVSTLDLRTRKN